MMISFHGKTELKDQLVANLKAHQAADEVVQGHYWEDGKGCAVGCSIVDFGGNTGDHSEYERLFGIPRVLARLEDGIFEGLSVDESKAWPLAFAEAVPVGADLSNVIKHFLVWLLGDVKRHAAEDGKKAVDRVIELYRKEIGGDIVSRDDWLEARHAAYAAADAADAAADAAAYAAAYAAADAAADAAAYAAYAAADADAADAAADADARQNSRKVQAEKLIEFLRSAAEAPT